MEGMAGLGEFLPSCGPSLSSAFHRTTASDKIYVPRCAGKRVRRVAGVLFCCCAIIAEAANRRKVLACDESAGKQPFKVAPVTPPVPSTRIPATLESTAVRAQRSSPLLNSTGEASVGANCCYIALPASDSSAVKSPGDAVVGPAPKQSIAPPNGSSEQQVEADRSTGPFRRAWNACKQFCGCTRKQTLDSSSAGLHGLAGLYRPTVEKSSNTSVEVSSGTAVPSASASQNAVTSFPPVSRASFRQLLQTLHPDLRQEVSKWLPGPKTDVQPSQTQASAMTRRVIDLRALDESFIFGPKIHTPPEFTVQSLARRESTPQIHPFPLGSCVKVRSRLTGAVYDLTLLKTLGSGGEGQVYAADAAFEPSCVAVKVLTKGNAAGKSLDKLDNWTVFKVLRESVALYTMPAATDAQTASRLMHLVLPIDIVDVQEPSCPKLVGNTYFSCLWMVMPRHTCNLHVLQQLTSLSSAEMLSATLQMILAVMMVHSMGLLHHDIKLSNCLLTSDGHVHLGDFGMVAPMEKEVTCFVGTVAYMAPEKLQCIKSEKRRERFTEKSDAWSLGITLYRWWCDHKHPFMRKEAKMKKGLTKEGEAEAYFNAIYKSKLTFDRCRTDTPPAVEDAITALLVIDPEKRRTAWDLYSEYDIFKQPFGVILSEAESVFQ